MTLVVALASASFCAMAQTGDKINEAVMRVYDEHIAKNPGDYQTIFMRANQNFYNGNYDAAIVDVTTTISKAIIDFFISSLASRLRLTILPCGIVPNPCRLVRKNDVFISKHLFLCLFRFTKSTMAARWGH